MALQSQATRLTGRGPGEGAFRRDGAVTLSGSVSQYRITPDATSRAHTQATIRPRSAAGFQVELVPLHSPLLRESKFVSFPRLSNMLKFSRSSCLTSALDVEGEAHSEGHLGMFITSVPLKFSGPILVLEAIQASLQRSALFFIL